MLTAKYRFDSELQQWIGIIIDPEINEIVTMGVEFSKVSIKKWCQDTLVSWPITGKEAPDAFDRKH